MNAITSKLDASVRERKSFIPRHIAVMTLQFNKFCLLNSIHARVLSRVEK